MRKPIATSALLTIGWSAACLAVGFGTLAAQGAPQSGAPLVVGIKEAAPFVMRDGSGGWTGISIDLARAVALSLGRPIQFRELPDLAALLAAVQQGQVDMGSAAITVTAAREDVLDFSQPYYQTGLSIAVPAAGGSAWLRVARQFLSLRFLRIVVVWGAVLLLVGLLVWLFERRANADFDGGSPVRGVANGFWFSAVTMTTVGYGDKSPRTVGGRVVSFLWMFASLIVISSFTAAIASTLTVGGLSGAVQGPGDLHGVRVGTVSASTSASYLQDQRIGAQLYPRIEDALAALAHGQLDAVVYDAPILQYLVNVQRDSLTSRLRVLNGVFDHQSYGLALPDGSPLREDVDRAVLRETESDAWKAILFRFLGTV